MSWFVPKTSVGRLPACSFGVALVILALGVAPSAAQQPADNAPRPQVHPFRAAHPPVIDGALDDDVWNQAPTETTDWLSYNPLYGQRIPQRTTVWVAYDDDALYFAFKCDDPEPGGVKTSVSRRDNVFSDDWVGLGLDSLGTGQTSYDLMVNPSGVQMDLLNSVATGEDLAPDLIWDSAGRLTDSGYTVEIRVPLQSIRFKGGQNVRMGVMFWRRISRAGISVSWPAFRPGSWVFETVATMTFPELRARPPREVIPSTTFSMNQQRDSPSRWGRAQNTGDFGVSTKIGLTPTIILDATINPDFSQIESDAFQVLVNQRFPVYFSEKRPFFMEGAGVFTLAGTLGQPGQQSLYSAVNTRTIIDPVFGAKVTGNTGPFTFATLTAIDHEPGDSLPAGEIGAGRQRTFNVARGQYSLGTASYVGAIATDTEFAGGFNRVAGVDVSLKLSPGQRLGMFALESDTRSPRTADSRSGFGSQVRYSYDSLTWNLLGQIEHYDRRFQMDTAFINRVGETNVLLNLARNLYPAKTKSWLRRVQPFATYIATDDLVQGGNEQVATGGVYLYLTRQGFFRFDLSKGHEPFAGQRFKADRWRLLSNAQLFRWLRFYANGNGGYATFYHPAAPYQGRSSDVSAGVTYQPSGRFSEAIDFERVAFDRDATGERVYTVHILNTRTTYQFTNHFFLRAIVQYDSSQNRVLNDFLASYELRPGTVFYAGYGSLLEQRDFRDELWLTGVGRYQTVRRGLFLKASYLHRF
jgi:hypothetical protein